jgi:hypothetical protein
MRTMPSDTTPAATRHMDSPSSRSVGTWPRGLAVSRRTPHLCLGRSQPGTLWTARGRPPAAVLLAILATFTMGCATARGPRFIDVGRATAAERSNWSRVRALAPVAPIVVRPRGGVTAPRIFLGASGSELLVLNVSDATLPAAAVRALMALAVERPDALGQVRASGVLERDGVRIGRDGVWVRSQKVAELVHVVETLARADVDEVRGPVVARGSVGGTLLGAWLGFAMGAVPGLGGADTGLAWVVVTGATMSGGALGHRWSTHTVQGLVYQAARP